MVISAQNLQKSSYFDAFQTVINAIGLFFVLLGLFFPIFYIQVYCISKGLDSTVTFYSLAILNAGSVFGRVLPNL